MKIQSIDNSPGKLDAESDGDVLFQSGSYNDNDLEEMTYINVMRRIEAVFQPGVLVGSINLWHGRHTGYKYCRNFSEFLDTVSGYQDTVIRQVGTRVYFSLIHHDGRHEMELRRFTEYGYDNLDKVNFDVFNQAASKFIKRHTRDFWKSADL
jgi:hypothetical protein